MKLKNVGSNQVVVNFRSGIEILFSYDTPVAGFIPGTGYVRTDLHYSSTTSKHINSYLGSGVARNCNVVAPDYLESLL